MSKTKILLIGDKWEDRKGTTVEAKFEEDSDPVYRLDVGGWACDKECTCGYAAVEVPYLIGEKVRLTGSEWAEMGDGEPEQGDVVEIVGYDEDHEPTFEWGGVTWYVYNRDGEDFSATPVESFKDWRIGGPVSGDTLPIPVDTGYVIPKSILATLRDKTAPKSDEHPNFIQVWIETEDDKEGARDIHSFSAKRDPFAFQWKAGEELDHEDNPVWELGNVVVASMNDVWGLRLVLNEIERRIGDE